MRALPISLDRAAQSPLPSQIAGQVRDLILAGNAMRIYRFADR